MNKLSYVIVEDEPLALERLRELLSTYRQLQFVGGASNGQRGRDLISETHPDIVFLDIEMPMLNGFELLAELNYQPKVVFTTAYEQYALRAFEENSVDYLLKPISELRLSKAINKLMQLETPSINWSQLGQQMQLHKEKVRWSSITVSVGNGMKILPLEDVCYFKAEDKYVMAHDLNGKKHLIDRSLKELVAYLPLEFMRIHRGIVLNFDYIKDIRKNYRSLFVFRLKDKDATELTCGNSYLTDIKTKLHL